MNIIDITLEPLTDAELKKLKLTYTQDFDKLDKQQALTLLKLLIPSMKSTNLDSELSQLVLRRLNMILDFKNYPERLI